MWHLREPTLVKIALGGKGGRGILEMIELKKIALHT